VKIKAKGNKETDSTKETKEDNESKMISEEVVKAIRVAKRALEEVIKALIYIKRARKDYKQYRRDLCNSYIRKVHEYLQNVGEANR